MPATLTRLQALEAQLGGADECPECRGRFIYAAIREGEALPRGCPRCGRLDLIITTERVPTRTGQQ